ncbi:MAG: hypothetical protein RIM23_20805 [Coleofasciculus sp. G3-WIS-01]
MNQHGSQKIARSRVILGGVPMDFGILYSGCCDRVNRMILAIAQFPRV